jgi:hypothetical protein
VLADVGADHLVGFVLALREAVGHGKRAEKITSEGVVAACGQGEAGL